MKYGGICGGCPQNSWSGIVSIGFDWHIYIHEFLNNKETIMVHDICSYGTLYRDISFYENKNNILRYLIHHWEVL